MKLEFVRPFLMQISEGCAQEKRERESRPVLGAIYLQIDKEGTIEGVSTDSYVLIHRSAKLAPKPLPMDWTLFDAYRLKQAMKWFGQKEPAEITFAKTGITISSAFVTITVPPTEGEFPGWQRLKPKGDTAPITTIAFNPSLATKIQKAFDGSPIQCFFYSESKPMLVRPTETLVGLPTEKEDQWAILMPVRMPNHG